MVSELRECKRCLLYEMADKAQYESVRAYVDSIPESERAAASEYDRRLLVCKGCEFLISGMCRKCGCYVEVRAAIAGNRCPDYPSKW